MITTNSPKEIRPLSFTVRGIPTPSGSRRIMPIKRSDGSKTYRLITDKRTSDWIATIRTAASNAMKKRPPLNGPIAIRLLFIFPRPKKHYRGGKKEKTLKENAPKYVIRRPDLDKLARAALDALTGTVFLDDSQVVKLEAQKIYSDTLPPGIKIHLAGA